MSVPLTKFYNFSEDLAKGVHNLSTGSLKIYLSNTAPDVSADLVKADLPTEVSNGNGYTTGGVAVTTTSLTETTGVTKLVLADAVLTAAGGTVGPFRYATLYNDTPTSPADPVIGFADYGASITLNDGETMTFDFDQAGGAITIT